MLDMGVAYGGGASMGFGGDKDSDIVVLGSRGCSSNGLREEWTVKQKINGKWVVTGRGVFWFRK